MRTTTPIIWAVLCCLTPVLAGQPADDAQAKAIVKLVQDSQRRGIEGGDFKGYMAIWSDDARMVFARSEQPGKHDTMMTRAQIEARARLKLVGQPTGATLTFAGERVDIAGVKAVLRYRTTHKDRGNVSVVDEIFRLRKIEGAWKVYENWFWPVAWHVGERTTKYDAATWKKLDEEVERQRGKEDLFRESLALLDALRFQEAHAAAKKLSGQSEKDRLAWVLRGHAAVAIGDADDALSSFTRALALGEGVDVPDYIPRASLRLPLNDAIDSFGGTIKGIAPDGTVHLGIEGLYQGTGPLTRHYYGIDRWHRPTKIFRAWVTEDRAAKTAILRVAAPAANKLKLGEQVEFVRPAGWSEFQLKRVPDFALVEDGTVPQIKGMSRADSACLADSIDNLRSIGLALHAWADSNGGWLPPAVIHGPDGKPWHSWRVLLLPYLEQNPLYERYRFDEPWDGPNNSKLLKMVPAVYRDPVHGKNDDHFTHCAAVTGPGTAFPAAGVKMENPKAVQEGRGGLVFPGLAKRGQPNAGQKGFIDLRDGVSNTILMGSVGPERKIPWTKPEDVMFGDALGVPGAAGSFAAPYRSSFAPAGLFLLGDASVKVIRRDIDPQIWRSLFRIDDGLAIDWQTVPGLGLTEAPTGFGRERLIRITLGKAGATALYVIEERPGGEIVPPAKKDADAKESRKER